MTRRQSCSYLIPLLVGLMISHSSLAQSDSEETVPYVSVAHSATPVGRVRVVVTKHRPRIHLARVQQPVARLVFEEDDTDYYDELPDIQVGYRRPELINQSADVDLPDNIKIRLLLARKKALEAYQNKWG